MPDTTKSPKSEAPDAKKAQEEAKPAQPSGPPMPNPDSMTRLHETLPESLPKATNEPGGPTPGTLPEDPTQATDPGAAKPGTPGVD